MTRPRWLGGSSGLGPKWLAGLGLAALITAGAALAPALADGGNYHHPPRAYMPHVFVIMMENASSDQLLSPANPDTAYVRQLAAEYGLATRYFGVTHVSLPNYLAATSGSTWGSNSDDDLQASLLNHTNIVDQLSSAGISWKAYMESLPYPGFAGPSADGGLYLKKHDPFMVYPDVANDPARARQVVPLTQLTTDLARNRVPQFVWITPNVCNDMHGMSGGACPYASAGSGPSAQLYQDGNSFLRRWVKAIMSSPAWNGNSTIFVTWDEGSYSNLSPYGPTDLSGCCDSPILPNPPADPSAGSGGDLVGGTVYGGGRVPMIVIAREGARHYTNATPTNHYSLLQTIEENFGLSLLNHAGDTQQVPSLAPFLSPSDRR